MPFQVETVTTVKWVPKDGATDDSRFMIHRKNGNLYPLIGTADWTDGYPSYRLCLVQECWPENVMEAARRVLLHRGRSSDELHLARAFILDDLRVGLSALRIRLVVGRFDHGLIPEHEAVIDGIVTGFSVID